MCRIYLKLLAIVAICTMVSCGPKKGIVTKKKDQNKRTEVVVAQPKPKVNDVDPSIISESQPVVKDDIEIPVQIKARIPKSSGAIDVYIAEYADIAITEMRRYEIPASITLAQGILESAAGRGRLAVEANNHFGIKCHGWKGDKIYHDDDRSEECFRKYDDPLESYEDHSKFLTQRQRYALLFDLKIDDYKAWAKGLKKAGYATDRRYPKKLIEIIELYDLDEYDREALKGFKRNKRKGRNVKQIETTLPPTVISYVVKQGDTLFGLSRRFGMSVTDIKSLNGLTGDTINIGQTLKVVAK